jgi:hypothetical protein
MHLDSEHNNTNNNNNNNNNNNQTWPVLMTTTSVSCQKLEEICQQLAGVDTIAHRRTRYAYNAVFVSFKAHLKLI